MKQEASDANEDIDGGKTDAIVKRRIDSAGELAALPSCWRSVKCCLTLSKILLSDVAAVVNDTTRPRYERLGVGASI